MMPKYTVQDSQTGKKITFEWNDINPPGDADMEEIFAQAKTISPAKPAKPIPKSFYGKFSAGVGRGMEEIFQGIQQRGLEAGAALGLTSPERLAATEREIAESRQAMAPIMGTAPAKVGQFIGQALPLAPIPGGYAGGLLGRMGGAALAGGATGALQPTTEQESALTNAVVGAGLGAGLSGGASAVAKGINTLREPIISGTQRLAEKYGIRTTLGEITQNPIWQKAETWLEGTPFIGLRGFREKQRTEAEKAAKSFLAKYVVDPEAPDVMRANREYASGLFRALQDKVKGIADQSIEPSETRAIAKELLERYPDIFKKFQDTKTEGLLKDILKGTETKLALRFPGGGEKPITGGEFISWIRKKGGIWDEALPGETNQFTSKQSGLVGLTNRNRGQSFDELTAQAIEEGWLPPRSTEKDFVDLLSRDIKLKKMGGVGGEWFPTTEEEAKGITPRFLDFQEAWTLRDGIGEKIGQARRALASGNVGQTELGQLKAMFSAINKDIENWADAIGKPEIKTAIKTANDAYKNFVVKYDILERAMAKAEGTVGAGEMFSPKKFSTALKNIAFKDRALNKFSPNEIDEMVGIANIMQVVKRAGQFAENPPTGNRWGLPVTFGLLREGGYLVALPAASLARFLVGTNSGKRLAQAASRIEPDSPNMAELIKRIYQQAAKAPGILAAQQENKQ